MFYKQFTEKEIYAIEIYKKEGYNNYQISLKLNRSHTSINRIIDKYKSSKTGKFYANTCIQARKELRITTNKSNKQRIKHDNNSEFLIKYILSKTKKYWSPEQISGRLKIEENIVISKDTIYKFIYENYPELVKKYFRRKGKKYKHNRKEKYRAISGKNIELRPEIVEKRNRFGDWGKRYYYLNSLKT